MLVRSVLQRSAFLLIHPSGEDDPKEMDFEATAKMAKAHPGARHMGDRRITAEMTLRKGVVAWDLNGLAGQDWKSFTYRKRARPH